MRDLNSELDKMIEEHGSRRVLSVLAKWLAERERTQVVVRKFLGPVMPAVAYILSEREHRLL